jgi:signal transduction histidine kinase
MALSRQALAPAAAGQGPAMTGRWLTWLAASLVTAGGLIMIGWVALAARDWTAAARQLMRSLAQVGDGDFNVHLDATRSGLTGDIATAFNEMTSRLQHCHESSQKQSESHAAELLAVNQELQNQIAERKRAEESVHQSEQRLVALNESVSLLNATLEATADGILVVDLDGKIKIFNQQFKDIWRIPEPILDTRSDEEAMTCVLGQLKDPEGFVAKVRELYNAPERESSDTLELVDGRVLERYSKPQRVCDRIVGRVWSFRDITARHGTQEKQAELLRRVAEINEELTHFAYVVSHDLKAPLRGIKLLTEWLCTDYGDKLGDQAKEQLALLQSRVQRMHNLIEGVLQYSRVGRVREDMVTVNLDEMLPSIIDIITPPAHIHISAEGPLPTLICEKTRVMQVFQNLLTNAVKYMDKPEGQIRVTCEDQGQVWKFRVIDNGPGIEEKYFDRIFKIFQTLAPRDECESTGVGLTIVKKVVELYGGKVWVESVVGQGSTFLFTWPKQNAAAMSETPQPVLI